MDGYTVISTLGYWNGNAVMWVTMGVFILPLMWLMVIMRRPRRVGQFDMVYAGERPERPETTHFAHNFFAPYQRALGGLVRPGILRFWSGVGEGISASAGALRRIYTGNGQTYAVHILLFVARALSHYRRHRMTAPLWLHLLYALLTAFIVFNYGILLGSSMARVRARVQGTDRYPPLSALPGHY